MSYPPEWRLQHAPSSRIANRPGAHWQPSHGLPVQRRESSAQDYEPWSEAAARRVTIEAAGEAEYLLAGLGIAPHVAHLHRCAARLKECQRGLAVGDAFHGEEENLLHDPSTIPFQAYHFRRASALTLSNASASIRPLNMTTRRLSS